MWQKMSADEVFAREFAKNFPTPSTLKAIRYAELGILTWGQIVRLFAQAAVEVMAVVPELDEEE